MRFAFAVSAAIVCLNVSAAAEPPTSDRIRNLIFERKYEYGGSYQHMVDLPLWSNTRHLLEGESHDRLVKLLDEVAAQDLDETERGLRRRALLQHELWQLFDWTTRLQNDQEAGAKTLRSKLARAIRKVALTKAQIESLATNLPQADGGGGGAPNVLDEKQGWVHVGLPDSKPIGEVHLVRLHGRSTFGVFLNCGSDPSIAKALLKKLADFPFPLASERFSDRFFVFDPALPQVPLGSKVALLRRMLLIDVDGEPVGAPIVQSLQLRTILKIEPRALPGHSRRQEFTLDRARFPAGKTLPCAKFNLRTSNPRFLWGTTSTSSSALKVL